MTKKWIIYQRNSDGEFTIVGYRKGATYRGHLCEIFSGSREEACRRAEELSYGVIIPGRRGR